ALGVRQLAAALFFCANNVLGTLFASFILSFFGVLTTNGADDTDVEENYLSAAVWNSTAVRC
ncbi:MAG: hypothetical protein ACP5MD_14735, partial [Verrucomicrobiia bacterium]